MIIQCDQCNTKFKLDDARVPDKGIKVRCAKCKHVFMVQKETHSEEADLDFLLSGLGAPASSDEKGSLAGDTVPQALNNADSNSFDQRSDAAGDARNETSGSSGLQDGEFGEDFFAIKEETVTQEDKGPEFGEFSFENEETLASYDTGAAPEISQGKTEEIEFDEFPFEEETVSDSDAVLGSSHVSPEMEGVDFNSADSATKKPEELKSGEDFGDILIREPDEEGFIFAQGEGVAKVENQPMEGKPEPLKEAEEIIRFNGFSVPSSEDYKSESLPVAVKEEKIEDKTEQPEFGQSIFTDSSFAETTLIDEEKGTPDKGVSPEHVAESVSAPSVATSMQSAEEELPPLAISTRKKGSSFFSMALTTISILLVLAIAGIGFYVFTGGPPAFNKLGLSFIAKWAGMEVAEEGAITIKNPLGAFMVNREAGEIFVVSGEAVNNFKKPRASIQIKAIVRGPKGEILMQKTAYCGNVLSKEQLATLSMAKIEEAMGSPFGDSLANLGVQPGKSIPFVIVFSGVQKNATEFSTEVVGSTVATQ